MKKNIIYTSLLLIGLLLGACSRQDSQIPVDIEGGHTLSVHLTPGADDRAIVKDLNSKDVLLKWEVGNFDLNIVFKQGDVLKLVKGVEIKEAKGETCSFDVEIPEGIDVGKAFDLYGAVAENIKVRDGKILVGVGAHGLYELTNHSSNRDGAVPVWFKSENVTLNESEVDAEFMHLGAMAVLTIKNESTKPLKTAGFAVRPVSGSDEFYLKGALPFGGNTELPYINLLEMNEAPQDIMTRVIYPSVDIAAGEIAHVGFWFRPNALTQTPEVNLVVYDAETRQPIVSKNTRQGRSTAMEVGKAYNLYATWNGTDLTLQDQRMDNALPENQPKIVITTTQKEGEMIPLIIGATDSESEKDVWIDLNGNGQRDLGEFVTEFSDELKAGNVQWYKIGAQTVTVYGNVKDFCYWGTDKGQLTHVDVSENTLLDQLFVFQSNLNTLDLSKNTKLRRVGFENCGLTSVTMPTMAPNMQELYLTNNKLTSVDITSAVNVLGFSLAGNQLTSVKYPKFATLWIGEIEDNQLSAASINIFLHSLQKAQQKYAEWMYTAYIFGNPGTATADKTIGALKGWTIVTTNPDAEDSMSSEYKLTARKYLSTPLATLIK